MYIPRAFNQQDRAEVEALIGAYPFATLVTNGSEGAGPYATHIPLLFDPERGENGTLIGHLALGNPHGRALESCGEALAIFHGPQRYISHRMYATSPHVPTWNYAVVHVYGKPRVLREADATLAILERLALRFEGGALDVPEDFQRDLVRAIVGLEIEVSRIEAKFKLSQNRDEEDREAVIRHLEAATDENSRAMLELMKKSPRR